MSNKGLVLKQNISNIAEEIRQSLGISTTYKPRELAQAIHNAILKYKQNNPTATSTDGILTNAYDVPMVDYKIDGKSEQDSTTGKNLLEPSFTTKTQNGITVAFTDEGMVVSGNSTSQYQFFTIFEKELPAGNYIINGIPGASYSTYAITVGKNGENIGGVLAGNFTFTLNEPSSIRLNFYPYLTDYSVPKTFKYQLEQDSTATSYEPYTGGQPSPNPDYPQEIRAVGDLVESGEHAGKYEIPVRVSGKNLFGNLTWITGVYSYFQLPKVDTYYSLSINLKEGKTIPSGLYFGFSEQGDYSSSQKVQPLITNGELTFSSVNNYKYGFLNYCYVYPATYKNNILEYFDIQLEEGSTATPYEPYHTPITTPIYLDRPLYNLPNGAKDKIRFSTGKRTNAVGEVVLDGSESWTIKNITDTHLYFSSNKIDGQVDTSSNIGLCNRLKYDAYIWDNDRNGFCFVSMNYNLRLRILNTLLSEKSVVAFKSWLSTHNTQVLYELATPTEETIDLPQLNLWEGTNIIEIGTEIQPSSVEYVYITKVGE